MALAVETVKGGSGAGFSTPTTGNFALSTSNIIIAFVSMGDPTLIPSTAGGGVVVDWNTSEVFTAVPSSEAYDSNFCSVRAYYLLNPTATTAAVVAHPGTPTSVEKYAVHVICISGADVAGTPLGSATTDGADVGSDPDIVVSSAAGNIVVSVLCTDASGTTTNGGTTIANFTLDSDTDHYAQYQTASGASTTCAWTSGASLKAMAGVAVKAAAVGDVLMPQIWM